MTKRMTNIKILVTGGGGKVGSEVVKELRRQGAEVRAIVRKVDRRALESVTGLR